MKKTIAALLVLLAVMANLSAQHDAHEHGIAELHIHIEEQEIEMELHLPGADFIGFEHSDLSEEEEHALHEKIEMIENSEGLVKFRLAWFRKAGLEMIEVHEGDDEHEAHEEHSEYVVELHFSIEDQKHLRSADFSGLFDLFPTLEEVDWILISHMGQEAGMISQSEPRIKFQ